MNLWVLNIFQNLEFPKIIIFSDKVIICTFWEKNHKNNIFFQKCNFLTCFVDFILIPGPSWTSSWDHKPLYILLFIISSWSEASDHKFTGPQKVLNFFTTKNFVSHKKIFPKIFKNKTGFRKCNFPKIVVNVGIMG